MPHLPGELREKIAEEEQLRAAYALQARLESEGTVPRTPTLLLRKFHAVLEYAGGILLGLVFAATTVAANFLVWVRMLHIEF